MSRMTVHELRQRMAQPESYTLEFKAARESYSKAKALQYLCALANEGGGELIFGVTDKQPREVVGSRAFLDVQSEIRDWQQTLGRHVKVTEIRDEPELFGSGRRVLVVNVEGRPAGDVVTYKGVAYVRNGESLGVMPAHRIRQIALEGTDLSAEHVVGTSMEDVDLDALAAFRRGVVARASGDAAKQRYELQDARDLLHALGLVASDGTLTNAALLLVGREYALRRWLARAEVIFEKKKHPASIRYEVRHTFRRPLLLSLDEMTAAVMPYARLDPIEVQDGMRVTQVPRYSERSVREAILNAVTHRDYSTDESVFVDLSSEALAVTSPGAFPGDVTPENVAEKRFPRNRLLAESLEKCGLIERSGQGVDLMMLAAVRLAQPLPLFEEPEGRRVRVTLTGRSDEAFFEFARQIPDEIWDGLHVEDFRTLDAIRRRAPSSQMEPESVQRLLDVGLVQRTAGSHPRPADRWLAHLEESEQRRLTLEGLKDLLVEALRRNEPAGLSISEIEARFPDQSRSQLLYFLNGMRGERVELRGSRRWAKWHALPA